MRKGTVGEGATVRWAAVLGMILLAGQVGLSTPAPAARAEESGAQGGIPPETVAEWIHEILQAERSLYTTHVVERMQELGLVLASEAWRSKGALPLPAQMLKMAGREVQGAGIGLRFRLASLWPIYEENGPADQFERAGLESVGKDPSRPYTGFITRSEQKFFKAIYADRAISRACVDCHNNHALSARRDYQLNEVMGGLIISFPVE